MPENKELIPAQRADLERAAHALERFAILCAKPAVNTNDPLSKWLRIADLVEAALAESVLRAMLAAARQPEPHPVKEEVIIDAIALLDVALAGTLFTKPRTGQIIVNRERAEKVLDGLRAFVRRQQSEPQRLAERAGWRPIDEDTPIDGHVLIHDPFCGVCEAIQYGAGNWMTFGANGRVRCNPSVWQPLPEPPQ